MVKVRNNHIIMSCLTGNWLEWYEFAIFGFLIKPLSHAFSPSSEPFISAFLTYTIFATGFIMRPLGGLICGYLGDRKGRKTALLFSITLMALPTFCVGILPTYEQIGILAPLLLMLCRLFQGISIGGEFSGSVIYLIEHAPQDRRGFFAVWADMGSTFGMISAILTVIMLNLFLSEEQLYNWGWRIPFIFGLLLGVIGYYLRQNLDETPLFRNLSAKKKTKNPLKKALFLNPFKFILSILFLASNAATYYFLIIYLPQQLVESKTATEWVIHLNILLPLLCLFCTIPASYIGAILSDRFGPIPCLIAGYLCTLISIYPILYATFYLEALWQCAIYAFFSFSVGFCFAPRSNLIVQMFPVEIRYTGVSFSYNITNAIFGGLSPLICMTLVQWTSGNNFAPGLWISVTTFMSLFSIFGLHYLKKKERILGDEELRQAA